MGEGIGSHQTLGTAVPATFADDDAAVQIYAAGGNNSLTFDDGTGGGFNAGDTVVFIGTQKRIKELTELLDNYPRYKENKTVYLEWQSITNPKKKEKFYDKHYGEIALFKTTKSFFDSNLNGAKLTPKAWQRELDELKKSAEVDRAKVEKLGDDVAIMETLIYNVQRLTNYEEKQNEIRRRRSAELE